MRQNILIKKLDKATIVNFLLLLIFLLISNCSDYKKVKIISLNIRCENKNDGINNWNNRKTNLASFLRTETPDIICMQEVVLSQLKFIKTLLPKYHGVGVGRNDGKDDGEHTPIFFDTTKFVMVNYGNFWLSETPNKAGAIGWDAKYPRIATWVHLKNKSNNKSFVVLNTHLDNVGVEARRKGMNLILDSVEHFIQKIPVIITGDFNADQNSDTYKIAIGGKYPLHDAFTTAKTRLGVEYSFHNFGKNAENKRKRIDHVFVNNMVKILKMDIPKENDSTGSFLSDHNPIITYLMF